MIPPGLVVDRVEVQFGYVTVTYATDEVGLIRTVVFLKDGRVYETIAARPSVRQPVDCYLAAMFADEAGWAARSEWAERCEYAGATT